jgi:hypothetical protein
METYYTDYLQEECPDELLIKMKKWGLISKNEAIKDLKSEASPKLFKLQGSARAQPMYAFACFDPSVVVLGDILSPSWVNLNYLHQNVKNESVEEVALKKRVDVLEKQCAFFAKKLKAMIEQNREAEKPKESDLIYNEHKAEYEEKYSGKIIAIDNAERKVVGVGDTILEAYEKANAETSKTKFSFKRVGYTDRL